MSFKFSDISKYFTYLPFVDVVVKAFEDLKDKDSTKDKIADVFTDLLAGAAPLIIAKNPALADEVNAVVAELTNFLERWSATSAPAPAPAPVTDPTSNEFSTLEEAISFTSDKYPFVVKRADGKFSIWPNVGPFPGEKVYPA